MPVVEEFHSTPEEPKQRGRWRRRMVRTAPLLAAAALGGGLAAGVVVAVDDDGGTTTVIQDAEATPESSLTPVGGETEEPTATTADLEVSNSSDVLSVQ
jgi:anti-sigma factor RsiW